MSALLFELDSSAGLAASLCRLLGCEKGQLERRPFPDGETYLRILTHVEGRDVMLLCTLDRPDSKLAPLLFAAAAAKAQGARSVGLIAPYLAYLRQDRAFRPGEAVTSQAFARLISDRFDWVATINPHLHRYSRLEEIYSVPSVAGTAAAVIGAWLEREVQRPVIVGPDIESGDLARNVASAASASSALLSKTREGDFSVAVDASALALLREGTAVVVDDIVSTASTMIETVKALRRAGYRAPVCIAVHPIFAGESFARLAEAGAGRIVSTNAVAHESNAIDISGPLAEAAANALDSYRSVSPRRESRSRPG